ncbi:MAG: hypothetical protein K0Q74_621 [Gammaproteobacteria bacterium]|nr:hypothetical protein [Gammaproteobacteria bacterium]
MVDVGQEQNMAQLLPVTVIKPVNVEKNSALLDSALLDGPQSERMEDDPLDQKSKCGSTYGIISKACAKAGTAAVEAYNVGIKACGEGIDAINPGECAERSGWLQIFCVVIIGGGIIGGGGGLSVPGLPLAAAVIAGGMGTTAISLVAACKCGSVCAGSCKEQIAERRTVQRVEIAREDSQFPAMSRGLFSDHPAGYSRVNEFPMDVRMEDLEVDRNSVQTASI